MAHGGKRRGAGRKKGAVSAETKRKQIVEQEFRAYMLREKEALWRAQRERAAGAYVLMVQTPDGYKRVTDPQAIERIITQRGKRGVQHWLIEAQAADVQLAKEINNRLMGLPTQLHEVGAAEGQALP